MSIPYYEKESVTIFICYVKIHFLISCIIIHLLSNKKVSFESKKMVQLFLSYFYLSLFPVESYQNTFSMLITVEDTMITGDSIINVADNSVKIRTNKEGRGLSYQKR